MSGAWAFIADLHLDNHRAWGGETVGGLNDRARRTLAVVREVAAAARREGCSKIAILGDVFNRANPTPQLVAGLAQVLLDGGVEWHLLVGNHDMVSEDPGDHALAPLAHVPRVFVHERPAVVDGVLFAPYRRQPVTEWLPELLALHRRPSTKVLAAHFGLITSSTPDYLLRAPDAAASTWLSGLLRQNGYEAAFLGNWHQTLDHGRCHQLGTICPHSFSDAQVGVINWWDGQGYNKRVYADLSAPSFLTWDFGFNGDYVGHENTRSPFYMRVVGVPRAEAEELRRDLAARVSFDRMLGFELEVVPDKREAPVATIAAHFDRMKLAQRYIERTFGGESKETRKKLLKMMADYGALR